MPVVPYACIVPYACCTLPCSACRLKPVVPYAHSDLLYYVFS